MSREVVMRLTPKLLGDAEHAEIVQELVRCGDCRYFDIVNQPYDQTWCVVMRDSVKPDGYCYRGERREG